MNYKIAVMILFYDCEQFILKTIENCAPHVDKIFITYSPEPWSRYNKNARNNFKNNVNPKILNDSKYINKIQLIEGVWDTEEQQRNDCLKIAKEEGFDFLIIQDADEFYLPEEFKKNIDEISNCPDFDYYRNPWYFFWKNTKNIIVNWHPFFYNNNIWIIPRKNTKFGYSACFAINCKKDVWFKDKRLPNSKKYLMLSGICYHLAYVLSDSQLINKLNTWGHSHQVNINRWLRVKWYGFKKGVKNIHPICHIEWPYVEEFYGELPMELLDFNPGIQKYIKPPIKDVISCWFYEYYMRFTFILKDIKYLLTTKKVI